MAERVAFLDPKAKCMAFSSSLSISHLLLGGKVCSLPDPLLFFQTKLSLSFLLSPSLNSFIDETKPQKGTLNSLVKLTRNNLEQEAVSSPLSCRSLDLTPPTLPFPESHWPSGARARGRQRHWLVFPSGGPGSLKSCSVQGFFPVGLMPGQWISSPAPSLNHVT